MTDTIHIDISGARWAYRLGLDAAAEEDCPFVNGTPHAEFWYMGNRHVPYMRDPR